MRVFVINLGRDTERLKVLGARLEALGMRYERFPAVEGATFSQEELREAYDAKWAMRLNGRALLPGEIGCALSHLGVYRKIVRERIPHALILEDDAYPLPALPEALQALEREVSSVGATVVLLGEGAGPRVASRHRVFLHYSVYALDSLCAGLRAHAYVVTLAAAERLSRFLFPVVMPADMWGRMVMHGVIRLYAADPLLVGLDCSSGTTISDWGEPAKRLTFAKRWVRRLWRLWWLWCDRFFAWRRRRAHG